VPRRHRTISIRRGMDMYRLLSQLAHVELLTPDLDASTQFAVDMLGMDVVAQHGDSTYLRCWGDYYSHSLVLTRKETPGLGHASWRTDGEEQLKEAVERIEHSGVQGTWLQGKHGYGDAYKFVGPGGHTTEVFWDVERAKAPKGEESPYPDRPQRASNRGMGVRFLDHMTVTTPDVKETARWHREALGFRTMGAIVLKEESGPWMFAVNTTNEKSHDLGLVHDFEGQSGRMHHLAFWVDQDLDLHRGAEFLIERGWEVDYGPGKHGIGEQSYLYFRDPVGLRYEINTGGYRNYVPDWQPAVWTADDGPNNYYRTELGMPAVHQVAIPPGTTQRGPSENSVAPADLEAKRAAGDDSAMLVRG
jgi:catechol 2,3-dioxygenase